MRPGTSWCVAAAWSAGYLVLGVVCALGGPGYPFAGGGPGPGASVLDPVPSGIGGWVLAGLAATAGAAVVLTASGRPRRLPGPLAIAVGLTIIVILTDMRVLMIAGYLPVMAAGAVLGHVQPTLILTMATWPNLNQMVLMVAGVCLATIGVSGLTPWFRGDGSQTGQASDETRAAAAFRVGRRATLVAVIIPVGYAITRIGWFFGIPVGISATFLARVGEAAPHRCRAGCHCAGGRVPRPAPDWTSAGNRTPAAATGGRERRTPPYLTVYTNLVK